jgi:hypothetical protein
MGHVHVSICSTGHYSADLRARGEQASLPIQIRRHPRLFDDARSRLGRGCFARMACRAAAGGDRKPGRIEVRSSLADAARGAAGTTSRTDDDPACVRCRATGSRASAARLRAGTGAGSADAMQQSTAAQILRCRQWHHSHLRERLCLAGGHARALSTGGRLPDRATRVGGACTRHRCRRRAGRHGDHDNRRSRFPPSHEQPAWIVILRDSMAPASQLLARTPYRSLPIRASACRTSRRSCANRRKTNIRHSFQLTIAQLSDLGRGCTVASKDPQMVQPTGDRKRPMRRIWE